MRELRSKRHRRKRDSQTTSRLESRVAASRAAAVELGSSPANAFFSPTMNPSRLFILRPVATSLLMLAILLAGVIAYRVLPISALPQVDYPTIQIVTLYPGATPDGPTP